jgi:hypothetical protein
MVVKKRENELETVTVSFTVLRLRAGERLNEKGHRE